MEALDEIAQNIQEMIQLYRERAADLQQAGIISEVDTPGWLQG